jgi:hypothetical protein
VDREGSQQEWKLLHIASAKDGGVWSIRQRASGTCFDQHSTEGLCWTHEFEGQDSPDSRQQLDCKFTPQSHLTIYADSLKIAPIQNSVYLVSMAIIAGAKTIHQVHATWKAGFMPVMKVSWITSPLALAFAQQFLPEHAWVPFFNIVAFFIGTYVNSVTKKKRLAALRKRYDEGSRGGRPDDYPGSGKRDY